MLTSLFRRYLRNHTLVVSDKDGQPVLERMTCAASDARHAMHNRLVDASDGRTSEVITCEVANSELWYLRTLTKTQEQEINRLRNELGVSPRENTTKSDGVSSVD